eukprot:gnl/Spiro4/28619_TR14163_c0_g1_i1.p1 gnl/Spiro4/28619_TR14163_c0_g1~~gnl/Spiro4/28619_TR14163_c0_g1_i1.p1  ORF type:complete len:569 (+),score=155.79 gnl/Spiro4/28619_TR14163_c0_g1_i1:568-2274(+)
MTASGHLTMDTPHYFFFDVPTPPPSYIQLHVTGTNIGEVHLKRATCPSSLGNNTLNEYFHQDAMITLNSALLGSLEGRWYLSVSRYYGCSGETFMNTIFSGHNPNQLCAALNGTMDYTLQLTYYPNPPSFILGITLTIVFVAVFLLFVCYKEISFNLEERTTKMIKIIQRPLTAVVAEEEVYRQLDEDPASREAKRLELKTKNLKYYWHILLLLTAVYGLPSIQLVLGQYRATNVTDMCYYNYRCLRSIPYIVAFNNVLSNTPYVVFGLFFCWIVKRFGKESNTTGLCVSTSTYSTLGLCLVNVGIFSAIYHMCPTQQDFQFDTSFMFCMGALMLVAIYQKRHARHIPAAYRMYLFYVCLLYLGFIGGRFNNAWFWGLVTAAWVVVALYASATIYYGNDWYFDMGIVKRFFIRLRTDCVPRDKGLFFMLVVCNLVSFSILFLQAWIFYNAPMVLVGLLITNINLYLVYYVVMKLRHNEEVHWVKWLLLLAVFALWSTAMYFFFLEPANTDLTPWNSRDHNEDCILFDFYDSHDVWHILSALSLFSILLLVFFIDSDVAEVPRHTLKVF